jgi:hypothetical protein
MIAHIQQGLIGCVLAMTRRGRKRGDHIGLHWGRPAMNPLRPAPEGITGARNGCVGRVGEAHVANGGVATGEAPEAPQCRGRTLQGPWQQRGRYRAHRKVDVQGESQRSGTGRYGVGRRPGESHRRGADAVDASELLEGRVGGSGRRPDHAADRRRGGGGRSSRVGGASRPEGRVKVGAQCQQEEQDAETSGERAHLGGKGKDLRRHFEQSKLRGTRIVLQEQQTTDDDPPRPARLRGLRFAVRRLSRQPSGRRRS